MIIKIAKYRYYIALIIIAIFTMAANAETVSSGNVKIEYEPMGDGSIKVINVWNRSDKKVTLFVDDDLITIRSNSSAKLNKHAKKNVSFTYATSNGAQLWTYQKPKEGVKEVDLPEET